MRYNVPMTLLALKIVVVLVAALLLGAFLRTWQMEHSANQKLFGSGNIPNPAPNGFYKGSVPGHTFSWLGKKFSAADSSEINVFDAGNGAKGERYPFATSVGQGIRDTHLNVVKIDYNIPGNSFLMRLILDEIVEVAPGEYLGKLHVRIIPGYPFTLAYFKLSF